MPKKTVAVGVHFNGSTNNGKLEIRVTPWKVGVTAGSTDYIEWAPVGINGQPNNVTWIEVEAYDPGTWPFPGSGKHSGSKPKTQPVKSGAAAGTSEAYTITVYFNDDQGYERSATLDPDMVIE
ncbi:MAG: hypothetical protein ACHQQ3_13590 [Gemmatimonadales bacterium]